MDIFSETVLTSTRFFAIIGKRKSHKSFSLFADIAQLAEHVIGNDEVGGSNPPISSKKPFVNANGFFVLFLPRYR